MLTGVIPVEVTNLNGLEVLDFLITILWEKYLNESSSIHLQMIPTKEIQGYVDYPCQRYVDLNNILHLQPTTLGVKRNLDLDGNQLQLDMDVDLWLE